MAMIRALGEVCRKCRNEFAIRAGEGDRNVHIVAVA